MKFRLLIEIEPTCDLGSVYPVAYIYVPNKGQNSVLNQHATSAESQPSSGYFYRPIIIRVSGPSGERGSEGANSVITLVGLVN